MLRQDGHSAEFYLRRCFMNARLGPSFSIARLGSCGAGFLASWEDLLAWFIVAARPSGERLTCGYMAAVEIASEAAPNRKP